MKMILALIFMITFSSNSFAWDDNAKRLTASDLAVQTHKYVGKRITTIANCFYADINEFRCMVVKRYEFARIDLRDIKPSEIRKHLEDSCDTTSRLMTKACRLELQFIYSGYNVMNNGSHESTVVEAEDDTAEARVAK